MPRTARSHFNSDIARARAILSHARSQNPANAQDTLLRDDLLRSSWMFAVGAMDAYFCDAYVSLLTRTLRAKALQASVSLPDFVRRVELPVGAILQQYQRTNWRWRNAVRGMMEKDNVLQPERVRQLFNPFVRQNQDRKLYTEIVETWAQRSDATARMFGVTRTVFQTQLQQDARSARRAASAALTGRVRSIIQRRHDCIHNCDRPKNAPQPVQGAGTVGNVIRDVDFLVSRCDELLDDEFPDFLTKIGCDATTRNQLRI